MLRRSRQHQLGFGSAALEGDRPVSSTMLSLGCRHQLRPVPPYGGRNPVIPANISLAPYSFPSFDRSAAVALKSFQLVNAAHGKPNHATEIRKRAEIRAGELLAEMKERGGRHTGDNTQNLRRSQAATPLTPTLADGVTKTQSSR